MTIINFLCSGTGYSNRPSGIKYQLKNSKNVIITCPSNFTSAIASDFASSLFHYHDEQNVSIDFRSIGFVEPFSSLVLAHGLKQFINIRQHKKLPTEIIGVDHHFGVVSYLKHIGFFKFCGIQAGKDVGEAPGSSNYLPFTKVRSSQIMWKGRVMQKVIDEKSDQLAGVIFPGSQNAGPAMMLGYSIREIIRNSFEHGLVSECTVSAQRWANGEAEIAIGDEGIGVYRSLSKTGRYPTPEKAIGACLLPGVSSQSVIGDTEWSNSGFGLYVCSELGKRFGAFEIISSYRRVAFNGQKTETKPTDIAGTLVRLRVSTADADYFPNILAQIVEEGERIAETLPGSVKSASKMSKTVPLSKSWP